MPVIDGERQEIIVELASAVPIAVAEGRDLNLSHPSVDTRLQLVKANRSAIYATLCRAVSNGRPMSDMVVVVADPSQPLGREVAGAAAMLNGAIINDLLVKADEFAEGQTAIIVVTVVIARNLLVQSHPSIASGLDRQPASGCVRVVAIADGTPALIHADIRPNAPIAQG